MTNRVEVLIDADPAGLEQGVQRAQQAFAVAAERIVASFAEVGQSIQASISAAMAQVSREAGEASRGGLDQLRQAGLRVFNETRTAAERLAAEERRLNELFRTGAIDAQTLARALSQARAAANSDAIQARNRAMEAGRLVTDQTRTATERMAAEEMRLNGLFRAGAIDADTLARALRALRDGANGPPPTGGFMSQLLGQFGPVALGLTAIAAGVAAMKSSIGTMNEFEQLDIQLKAVTGSAEKGKEAFAWVKDFAAKTPYDVQQTAQAFVLLKNNGLDPMDGTLAAISDTAAKYTQGSDGMIRAITQLTQAYGKGKIQAEDMNILAEQGIPVWAALSGALGKSETEVRKLSESGKLGKDSVKALIEELGRMSDGQAAAKMQSLTGLWSNFTDSIANALDTLRNKGGLDPMKEALSGVNEALNELKQSGALDAFMGKLGEVLGVAADTFGQLMGLVGDVLGAIGEAWDGLTGAVGSATDQQIGFMDILKGALTALELMVIGLRGVFEISWASIRAVGVDTVSVLVGAAQSLGENLARLATLADTYLSQAGIYFNTFGEVASRALALDFEGARAAYAQGMGRIEAEVRSSAAKIASIDAEAASRAKENAAARVGAANDVATAAERTAQRLQAALMKGVDGVATAAAPDTPAPGTPKPRSPVKLAGDTPDAGGKASSRMAKFEAQLAAKKLAHETENNLNATFFEFSKAQEIAHWAEVRARHGLSKQEQLAVEAKYQGALTAQRSQELKATVDALKAEADNRRSSMAERLAKEAELVALLARVRGTESSDYKAALKAQQALQDEADKQAVTDAIELVKTRQKLDLDALKNTEEVLRAEVAAGRISKVELLAAERQFALDKLAILKQSLADQIALMQQQPQLFQGEIKRAEGQQQEVAQEQAQQEAKEPPKLKRSEQLQGEELQLLAALGDGALAEGALNSFRDVEQGFGTAISGMAMRGQSFGASMRGLWAGLSRTFVQEMVTKPLTAWIAGQARMLAIKLANAIRERVMDTTTAATGAAANATAATAKISTNAVVAGSGAASAMSSIPYVGPILAIAAMAAIIGAVMGLKGSVKSAAGGYDIPRGVNPMTQLHEEEMVLPKGIAQPMREMLAKGGSSETHVTSHHFSPQINLQAWDGQSVRDMLRDNGGVMVEVLREQHRNFSTV